jgi:predicted oxidoreductase
MSTAHVGEAVVIGGGIAGIVTALELCDHKKKVILLDRTSEDRFGGLAKMSFGGLFFVGSPEQRLMGIKDSVELALRDWMSYGQFGAEDVWPRKWAEAYVSQSLERIRGYLIRRGVGFFPAVNWTERGYFVPGNSVPRFHIGWGTGEGVVKPLIAALREHVTAGRLTLLFDHTVDDLLSEGGRFAGARGVDAGGHEFTARGENVVIAAGGLAGNLDKVRAHWPPSLGKPPEFMVNGSMPEADGRFFDIAARHGANVTHLEHMWNYAAGVRHWKPRWPLHGLSLVPGKSAIWVNHRGVRFKDPPLVGSYDTLALLEQICAQPKPYSWQILNYRILRRELAVSGAEHNPDVRDKNVFRFLKNIFFGNDTLATEFLDNCPDFLRADALPELVAKMNELAGTNDVDLATLEDELRSYDANIDRGPKLHNDDQIRRIVHARQYRGDRLRTCNLQKILDPGAGPLVAIRLSVLTRKSLGGLQTDLHGRVLSPAGSPLPGLYAAGEAAGFGGGGMHGRRALEGTFLGGGIFSGQAVAESIAKGRGIDGNV